MAMRKKIEIECDECGNSIEDECNSYKQAKACMKVMGWVITHNVHTKQWQVLCPTCKQW